MIYKNVGKKDIIVYDEFSNKKMIKVGEEVDSERYPTVVGHSSFLNIGDVPTPKHITLNEKDEIKKALDFQKDTLLNLVNRFNKLENDVMAVRAELLKVQQAPVIEEKPLAIPEPEKEDVSLLTERVPKKNTKKKDAV